MDDKIKYFDADSDDDLDCGIFLDGVRLIPVGPVEVHERVYRSKEDDPEGMFPDWIWDEIEKPDS